MNEKEDAMMVPKTLMVLFVLVVMTSLTVSCKTSSGALIVGSTHLQGIAELFIDDLQPIYPLTPPGMCPGHYDMTPRDVERLSECRALLLHQWQLDQAPIANLIRVSKIPPAHVYTISLQESLMPPESQARAVDAVAEVLGTIDPAQADHFNAIAATRKTEILVFGQKMMGILNENAVPGTKVICNVYQAELLRWAGLDVVGTVGGSEDATVSDIERLIADAQEQKVTVMVDNLQSGDTHITEMMAQEVGASPVVLSNFPGGYENTETWEKALEDNVRRLCDAITDARARHG